MAIRTACNCLASLNPMHYLGKTSAVVGLAMVTLASVANAYSKNRTFAKEAAANKKDVSLAESFVNTFLNSSSKYVRVTQKVLLWAGVILTAASAYKIRTSVVPLTPLKPSIK